MGIDINDLPLQTQQQIARKLAAQQRTKPVEPRESKSKYHNTPAERSGESANIRFDSKREAARYDELMLMLKAGEIRDLKLQPQFTLQEAYTTPDGKRVRAIRYVADFSYEKRVIRQYQLDGGCAYESAEEWEKRVEDVKSKATKTRVYAMKRKMLMDKYGIEIEEIE